MHNAAVVARMRIPQTDRFETTLPKEHFFNSPPVKEAPKQSKRDWHAVIITGIVAVTLYRGSQAGHPALDVIPSRGCARRNSRSSIPVT
jgi:hypothetical protein